MVSTNLRAGPKRKTLSTNREEPAHLSPTHAAVLAYRKAAATMITTPALPAYMELSDEAALMAEVCDGAAPVPLGLERVVEPVPTAVGPTMVLLLP
jgi:hypothetical protein